MLRAVIGILLLLWIGSLLLNLAVRSVNVILLIAVGLFVVDLLTRRRAYRP
jgi:hypothetical protein